MAAAKPASKGSSAVAAAKSAADPADRGYVSDTEFTEQYAGVEKFELNVDNILIVDGLPIASEAKFSTLNDAALTIFSELAEVVKFDMPLTEPDAAGVRKTQGFAFVEFASKKTADMIRAKVNGFPFSKSHKLRVLPFNALKDILQGNTAEETYAPLACHLRPDAGAWLEDDQGRDQFAIAWSPNGRVRIQEVMWSDGRKAPTLAFPDEDGADLPAGAAEKAWRADPYRCYWSSKGTYLATLSEKGVQLWSGPEMALGPLFPHPNVSRVIFSPTEDSMVTWSGYPNNQRPEGALQVWDLRMGVGGMGKCLRPGGFKQRSPEDWEPDMCFSADGAYLARLDTAVIRLPGATAAAPTGGAAGGAGASTGGGAASKAGGAGASASASASASAEAKEVTEQVIMLYDMPSCKLNDSRSIRAPGAKAIAFTPAGPNLLAYWSPEREPHPATIVIMAIPSRDMLRQRNMFGVEECELQWHPTGSHLAVVARKTRKRHTHKVDGVSVVTLQSQGYVIEVFHCAGKSMPVFSIEVPKEQGEVRGLFWEPTGARFALVVGDRPRACDVMVYDVTPTGPSLLYTLKGKPCQRVYWSPVGEYAVLAGGGELAGTYEFYDMERNKSFASVNHAGASGASWDPSGRSFASYKCRPLDRRPLARELVDNGYQLFTFQGIRVTEPIVKTEMLQFEWRPRPASLLTEDEKKAVAQRLRGFQHKYQLEAKKVDILQTRIAELEALFLHLTFANAQRTKEAAASSKAVKELRAVRGLGDEAALSGVREETTTYEQVIEEKVETVTA